MQLPTYSEWYVTARIARKTNNAVVKEVSMIIDETSAGGAIVAANRVLEGDKDWEVLTLRAKPHKGGKPVEMPAADLPVPCPDEPEAQWWECYGSPIAHPKTIDIGELLP